MSAASPTAGDAAPAEAAGGPEQAALPASRLPLHQPRGGRLTAWRTPRQNRAGGRVSGFQEGIVMGPNFNLTLPSAGGVSKMTASLCLVV